MSAKKMPIYSAISMQNVYVKLVLPLVQIVITTSAGEGLQLMTVL